MDIAVSSSFHTGHSSTLKWHLYVIVRTLKFCPLRNNKPHFCQIYLNPINMKPGMLWFMGSQRVRHD